MTTTEGGAANAARVADIQAALREAGLDGWLFYDFRQSDPLAYRILKLDPNQFSTRRWFYFVPAEGEPVRINHAIEQGKLDRLPGAASSTAAGPCCTSTCATPSRRA